MTFEHNSVVKCKVCHVNLEKLPLDPSPKAVASYIKSCAESVDLLKRLPPIPTFNWGGHSVSP